MKYRPHNLTLPRPALRATRPPRGGKWLRTAVAACLTFCFLAVSAYNDHRNARVDSLEAALKSSNPPKGGDLLWAYDELMRGYLPYDSAKTAYYGQKALALSYELNGLNVRQDVIRRFAQMLYAREEYDEAVALYQQALAIVDTMATLKRYTEKDIDDARSVIYGSLGNVYNMQDKAHLAIHYYQLALPIFEKYDWKESQTICYYNIGELYGQMDNLDEAERNYQKAIEKGVASGDSLMMAVPKKGLVGVYFNRGDHDQALRTADEVLAYYKVHRKEEPADYATMLAFKARILLMKGHEDVAAAKACVEEALPYIDNSQIMFDDVGTIYMAACEVAMAEHKWQQALNYGLRSIHPDSTATVADKGGYMLLAEIYMELGQKEKAREYSQKVYDMMSRYATDHYQSGLSQMEVLYETEKKEAQIAQLASERRQQQWLLGLAVALLVLAIALMVYFQLAHRRQKALLAAKVALDTETKERRILARDLHDSLGGMLSVLRLKIEEYKRQLGQQEQPDEVLPLLDVTHTELRRVAHHLMPEELLQGGLVSALHDFAISVPSARFQAIGDVRLSKEQELVLYRCAYELVNNAIKHAQAEHINIQLMQNAHEVTLTVSDDGKGISPLLTSPLGEEPANTFPPREDKREAGMGLQNIRERIEPYHGDLRIVSNESKGTEINVTLPL